MFKFYLFIKKYFEVILVLFWLITQLVIYSNFGIVKSVDSPVYIDGANNILKGVWPDAHDRYYISYIVFLAGIFYLGGGLYHVMVAQIMLSGVSAFCLYLSVLKISEDRLTSCIAVFFYIFWFKIHQWNAYIYTESFFTSLSIISFYILVNLKTWKQCLLMTPFFFLAVLVRPPGICLVISLLAFLLTKVYINKLRCFRSPLLFYFIGLPLVVILILIMDRMLADFSFIESYVKAEVIYPNIPFLIEKPEALFIPDSISSPLLRLLAFILSNPFYLFKLSLVKLLLFFGNVKPYFSWVHNAFIVIFLYPIYFFAIKGNRSSIIEKPVLNFLRVIIISQGAMVMLTSENWDGRFLIPVLPFIFVLAAFGMRKIIKTSDVFENDH